MSGFGGFFLDVFASTGIPSKKTEIDNIKIDTNINVTFENGVLQGPPSIVPLNVSEEENNPKRG